MKIKEAMETYYDKLNAMWQKKLGIYPLFCWDESYNQELFISEADEDDGEAEWQLVEIKDINLEHKDELCPEMIEFFSTFYYCRLAGEYNKIVFTFEMAVSDEVINKNINAAIVNGKYYYPDSNCLCIGTAEKGNKDCLIILYDQDNKNVFIYDQEDEVKLEGTYSLIEIISNMLPVI